MEERDKVKLKQEAGADYGAKRQEFLEEAHRKLNEDTDASDVILWKEYQDRLKEIDKME